MNESQPDSVTAASVLVADDEAGSREVVLSAFRNMGWAATGVDTRAAALAVCGATAPGYVVTEQQFPDGSGLDLLAEAKRVRSDARVVVVTRFGAVMSAVRWMRAGAVSYLHKPVSLRRLMDDLRVPQRQPAGGTESDSEEPAEDQETSLASWKWDTICAVLRQHGGNVRATARRLGIDQRGLRRKLSRGRPRF